MFSEWPVERLIPRPWLGRRDQEAILKMTWVLLMILVDHGGLDLRRIICATFTIYVVVTCVDGDHRNYILIRRLKFVP